MEGKDLNYLTQWETIHQWALKQDPHANVGMPMEERSCPIANCFKALAPEYTFCVSKKRTFANGREQKEQVLSHEQWLYDCIHSIDNSFNTYNGVTGAQFVAILEEYKPNQ